MIRLTFGVIWTIRTLVIVSIMGFGTQTKLSHKLGPQPELTVSGTSTLHDWEMVSEEARGSGAFQIEAGQIAGIRSVQVTMPARSLKSGKTVMDNNAYEALKVDAHPEIMFQLEQLTRQEKGKLDAKGHLKIAGVSREVLFTCSYRLEEGKVHLNGKTNFRLTDYDIEPPTAVLGTIKTGNEVEITFNVIFIS